MNLAESPGRIWRTTVLLGILALIGILAFTAGRTNGSFLASQARSFVQVPGQPDGTWATDRVRNTGAGSLRIGPFSAPYSLDFWVAGYPDAAGNDVHLEIAGLNIRLPVDLGTGDPEPRRVHVEFPLGWRGWDTELVATCKATGPGQWLQISRVRAAGPSDGPIQTALSWVTILVLYGLGIVVLSGRLERAGLPVFWAPLVAAGLVATAGYLVFWAYFLAPLFGRILSWLCLAFLAWGWISEEGSGARRRECARLAALVALAGTFYLGILFLYHSRMAYYQLSAERFIGGQPGDGRLTFDFANLFYHGLHPKELGAGWLTSDRPPLQEGWQLLVWPIGGALALSDVSLSGAAALYFQLTWIFALYGLLRTLGMTPLRALAWTAAAVPLGFFAMNSLYTWPKLSAGAFACGAFGIAFMDRERPSPGLIALSGLLAALACLSHGGAAFSLLGALPWVLWMAAKGRARAWALAVVVFLAAAAPWAAYQKLFAPPGDRLLKWHLAGKTEIDGKSLSQDLSEAYGPFSVPEIINRKLGNLGYQFGGDWRAAIGSPDSAEDRRADEANRFARSLEWLGIGAAALLLISWMPRYRVRLARLGPGFRRLCAWTLATMLVWCALLFTLPIVPHASYAMLIGAAAVCAAFMEAVEDRILPIIALAEVAMCVSTWMPPRNSAPGEFSLLAGAVVVGSLLSMVWLAASGTPQGADGA